MFLTCSCTSVAPNHQQQCDQQIAKSETSINAMTLAKYWKLDFSELIPGGKQTGCWEEWPEWPWSCFSVKVPHMVHTLYILISCINWAAASSLKKNCTCIWWKKILHRHIVSFCEDGEGWHFELNDPSGLASCLLCFSRRHAHHIVKQAGDVAAVLVKVQYMISYNIFNIFDLSYITLWKSYNANTPLIYPHKGSCTYYVITDGGGGSLQMITVLHRGGPANDYGIT